MPSNESQTKYGFVDSAVIVEEKDQAGNQSEDQGDSKEVSENSDVKDKGEAMEKVNNEVKDLPPDEPHNEGDDDSVDVTESDEDQAHGEEDLVEGETNVSSDDEEQSKDSRSNDEKHKDKKEINILPIDTTSDLPFAARLNASIGRRYSNSMRRSVQTVVLFEANRCLKERYHVLRPFQRKVALFDTARDIIETLDFIPVYHRMEIMFRTATAKLPLSPDLTWRRMKVIDREIKKSLIPKIAPLLHASKTHENVCREFIQREYETHATGGKGKQPSLTWEYTHMNHFLVYRMFYLGVDVNPNLPPARDPNPNRVVPVKKPPLGTYPGELDNNQKAQYSYPNQSKKRPRYPEVDTKTFEGKSQGSSHISEAEKRRAMLMEVKEHLELLKEFEGVISTKELKRRKRELFSALPSAPDNFQETMPLPKRKPLTKIVNDKSSLPESKPSNIMKTSISADSSDS